MADAIMNALAFTHSTRKQEGQPFKSDVTKADRDGVEQTTLVSRTWVKHDRGTLSVENEADRHLSWSVLCSEDSMRQTELQVGNFHFVRNVSLLDTLISPHSEFSAVQTWRCSVMRTAPLCGDEKGASLW